MERKLASHFMKAFKPTDVNVNILALLLRELDLHRCDKHYLAPFCPMKHQRSRMLATKVPMNARPFTEKRNHWVDSNNVKD